MFILCYYQFQYVTSARVRSRGVGRRGTGQQCVRAAPVIRPGGGLMSMTMWPHTSSPSDHQDLASCLHAIPHQSCTSSFSLQSIRCGWSCVTREFLRWLLVLATRSRADCSSMEGHTSLSTDIVSTTGQYRWHMLYSLPENNIIHPILRCAER